MKTLPNLTDLWRLFFLDQPQVMGLDRWCIVFIARDNTQLLVSLANPLTDEHEEVFIEHVRDEDVHTFVTHYKQRFVEQLGKRFVFFRPEVDRVLTEYPDWDTFYESWLNDDSKLIQGNMPLLFDYPNEQEYRAMQLKSADYAGYRRLLVVLYQYRKQQFQKVFIKNVDSVSYNNIQQQIIQAYQMALPKLIYPEGKNING